MAAVADGWQLIPAVKTGAAERAPGTHCGWETWGHTRPPRWPRPQEQGGRGHGPLLRRHLQGHLDSGGLPACLALLDRPLPQGK